MDRRRADRSRNGTAGPWPEIEHMFDTCLVMSTLRSGLEEFRATELRSRSDGEIEHDVDEMKTVIGGLEAECARRIAELDRRRAFERDGHLSITSWVDSRFHTGWTAAAKEVRVARALEDMPATREALADGDVSSAAVGTLVAAREANPEAFAGVEDTLLDVARSLPLRDLRRVVGHWKEIVEPEAGAREEQDRFDRRGLHVSPLLDGMVRVDGNLDPESGQTLITALGAVTDAWAHAGGEDARTPAQRRADALREVCRQWLDLAERPTVSGERPHVTVTLDLESLEGRAGRRCELGDTGSITPESARRIACDASITRVITRGVSEPLEVGRRSPVVPASLRRALVVRDRGCRFPGCDRPQSWCDAHHVAHWADGGRTDLSNLVLLCRRHHRLTHQGFRIEVRDGGPVFLRQDGTTIEDRAPPALAP
jgi:Domain of unknown function (DUF222)/HNH endonuclease